MFKSKTRPLVVPQSEHLKLSGAMAYHWGNADFALPEGVDRDAFILGVATHDRAFGEMDMDPVGEIADARRVVQVRRWLETQSADPRVEIVVMLHLNRLMGFGDFEGRAPLLEEIGARLAKLDRALGPAAAGYRAADAITGFCDVVSFDFCFEHARQRVLDLLGVDCQPVPVSYEVSGDMITVDPWPFNVSQITGYLLAYEAEGYPDNPEPVLRPYTVLPQAPT